MSYGISIIIVQRKEVRREWSSRYLEEEKVKVDWSHVVCVWVCAHLCLGYHVHVTRRKGGKDCEGKIFSLISFQSGP